MPDTSLELAVICPWCGQGKTLADRHADIRVSCHCSTCRRFYEIDFRTMPVCRITRKPRKVVKKR